MKILISENHFINEPMFKTSQSIASSDAFKTVLNNIDNKNLTLAQKEESKSLCGIELNLADENKTVNNEDSSEKISSCYECEVKDDCQRFKNDKTDILMDKKISLNTKFDPNFGKKVPVFTAPNKESNNSLNPILLFPHSYYYGKKDKRIKNG